jgi:hypothetical protein
MWDGFTDMMDNAASVVFVVVVVLLGGWYISSMRAPQVIREKVGCDECIRNLRKDYRFVPRTAAEKRASPLGLVSEIPADVPRPAVKKQAPKPRPVVKPEPVAEPAALLPSPSLFVYRSATSP